MQCASVPLTVRKRREQGRRQRRASSRGRYWLARGQRSTTVLALRKCCLAEGGSRSCRPFPTCLIPLDLNCPRIDAVTVARAALEAQHQQAGRCAAGVDKAVTLQVLHCSPQSKTGLRCVLLVDRCKAAPGVPSGWAAGAARGPQGCAGDDGEGAVSQCTALQNWRICVSATSNNAICHCLLCDCQRLLGVLYLKF